MTAFNVVRFKVKAGQESQFLDAHNQVAATWSGLRHANIIKTGEHTFCIIGEWDDLDAMKDARASMIATLELVPRHARRPWRRARRYGPGRGAGRENAEIARRPDKHFTGGKRGPVRPRRLARTPTIKILPRTLTIDSP